MNKYITMLLLLVLFCPVLLHSQNTIFTNQIPVNFGNDGDYELGTKFSAIQNAEVTQIRFYKAPGETGIHIGKIWNSSGTLLTTVNFTNETSSGWQTAVLPSSLVITSGVVYIVSVNTNGVYPIEQNGLLSSVSNGLLYSIADGNNGVFNETPGNFPASSFNNSNYFVDLGVSSGSFNSIFTTQLPANEFNDGPYELGVKFTTSEIARVKYIKYFKPGGESGLHTGILWNSLGVKIAEVQFANESSSGWQYAIVNTPIYIYPGNIYVVSVNSNITYSATGSQALQMPVINGVLSTVADNNNGVFSGSPNTKGVFPTYSYNNANYFRDIVVEPIYPPDAPTLISPLNNSIDQSIETTVSWSAVSGAESYTLQVASDESFTLNVNEYTGITSTNYNLMGLANNSVYYWRVKAIKEVVSGMFSAAFKFTTVQFHEVVLSWPVGGVPLYTSTPTFTWYLPNGGTGWKFDLLYSTDINMINPLSINDLSTNLYTMNSLIPGTKYYWKIRVKNSDGAVVTYSSKESFVSYGQALVPIISYPTFNPVIYTLSPKLYWYLNNGSSGLTYEIELREGLPTVLTGVPNIMNISDMYYQTSNLQSNTQYSFKVRSRSGALYSDWSNAESFRTIEVNSVIVPIPSWPVEYPELYSTSPNLYWYLGTSNTGLSFEVEFVEGLATQFTGVPNITGIQYLYTSLSDLLPGHDYKWRVRSTDGVSYSNWSNEQTFNISSSLIVAPVIPNLSWPIGNATVYSGTAQLNWYIDRYVPGLIYEVEYSNTALNGTPVVTGLTNMFTVINGLAAGTNYQWRVRSKLGSTYSAWSETGYFNTVAFVNNVTTPVLSWPIGGATVWNVSTSLNWFLSSPANNILFELQYANNPDMTDAITVNNLSQTSYTLNGLVQGETYYWHVRSYDGIVFSAYSPVENFVIYASNMTVTPIPASPISGVNINSQSPQISWYLPTAGNVTGYILQYSKNKNMSEAVNKEITTSRFILDAPVNGKYYWRVKSRNSSGVSSSFSAIESFVTNSVSNIGNSALPPDNYSLYQNYPNPFNPVTVISYQLPEAGFVKISVYNVNGELVSTLVNEYKEAGYYSNSFNASKLSSGMYFYRMNVNGFSQVRKLMLLK